MSLVIAEDTEVGSVEGLLAAEGLRVESVTRAGTLYTARLKITDEAAVERKLAFAQGSGPTIAAALEDARQGWARWRDYLRRRSPATGEHEALADVLGEWARIAD